MGVDERNDHSFRIPRPDLSINSDNPNACNQCHTDKNAQWANDAMIQWYGKIPTGHQTYTHALTALRANSDQAPQFLYDVIMSSAPSLARATVTEYLGNTPSQQTYITTLQLLGNSDSDIRLSALRALEAFPVQMRIQQTFKALSDEAKIVRIEAAKQLSVLPQGEMDETTHKILSKGILEYKESLIYNSDRAESQVALAQLFANTGERQKAIQAYEEALRIQPKFLPAIVNYAQFYQNSDDAKSLEILEQGLKHLPDEAALYYAKGLWEIRHKHPDKALSLLEKAATMEPKNGQYQYVYAVAVGEKDPRKAIDILKKSLHYHSGDIQALYGLVFYYNQSGETKEGEKYQEKVDKLANFMPKL
jgi:tetratricopeptide (TPR) repeat protein